MKPWVIWCCLFLVLLAGSAGCTLQKTARPSLTVTPPPAAGTAGAVPAGTDGAPAAAGVCTLPPLVFDDHMPVTAVQHGFGFNETQSYLLPAGAVIYHGTDGMTRVFDANGTQILLANDSADMMPTPGGLLPATKVLQVPDGALVQADGNMTYIIQNGTCIGTTINAGDPAARQDPACHCPAIPDGSQPSPAVPAPDNGLCRCT